MSVNGFHFLSFPVSESAPAITWGFIYQLREGLGVYSSYRAVSCYYV